MGLVKGMQQWQFLELQEAASVILVVVLEVFT